MSESTFWQYAGAAFTGLVVTSALYLAIRAAAWLQAQRRGRVRRPKPDRFVVRLDRVRDREAACTARSKREAFCSECGFPLLDRKAPACPYCAVVFEVAS